ncbi:alpha/beta hydrolase [Aggregatilinea lenta]|uniref:alpha/beta hydrolase n=1 Tax=Aggregatilinea lenta TaxID=913108 RepID=UPI0013C32328|nr:alpha/beta hydrolase-fold protein [Aggregatilinea lenta]
MSDSPSRVVQPVVVCAALRDNPLGDPAERRVAIYLPPGYDDDPTRRYPSLYLLSSHGSTGPALLNWQPWDVSIVQQLDALIASGRMAPAIVVMPDLWTRFGSSQFINSAGIGRYEDALVGEIVPFVDTQYRTLPDATHRGVVGRSSGGYGALVQAMHHPEVFGAFACHSGDLYWEYTCLPGLSKMHQQIAQVGGLDAFIRDIPSIRPKGGAFWELVMTVCWAAAFGDNPDAPHGFDLPIDPDTGALDETVWARWLAHDPLRKLDDPAYADALRGARLAFIDVGSYDEYQLQVGARLLHRKLDALGIAHEYQEFPDGHRGTHYRYETSLPLLAEALR